ncbi:MAG: hypothetical protein ACXAES_08965 [Promethearchaeota archaeon]|jgi:hypothetical protein
MKKISKIRYAILIIAVITGFTCIFTTVVQGKPTKLVYEATARQIHFQIQYQWMEEDGVTHIIYYRESELSGTVDGIEFSGYSKIYGHAKIEPTGDYTINGKGTSKTTWHLPEPLEGTFYGHFSVKGFMVKIPSMGYFNGKTVMHGAGDYEGWKFFGESWSIEEGIYGISGTIFIPN